MTADDTLELQRLLLSAADTEDAVFLGADDYGQRYALDFTARGPSGTVALRSLWIVRVGEDFSRLTTCYIL